MPPDAEQIRPVSLPPAAGDAILHAEPLRHGQANAATGGIWRVRGPAGTAILKVARRPAATDPPKAFPTSDVPTHWNYWRSCSTGPSPVRARSAKTSPTWSSTASPTA
jgi:hypothetical protein